MHRVAFRTSTLLADVGIAALAFVASYLLSPSRLPNFGFDGRIDTLNLLALTGLYAALAGAFSVLWRRHLSPWRYVSAPDVLLLSRIVLCTVVVFLAAVFLLDRGRTLPRSALAMAGLFHIVGLTGVRLARRMLYERAGGGFASLGAVRWPQAAPLLLVGPTPLAEAYLREAFRTGQRAYEPVGIICPDEGEVGQQVRGVCMIGAFTSFDDALTDLRQWNRYPHAILLLDEPTRMPGLPRELVGRLRTEGVKILRRTSLVELHGESVADAIQEVTVEELLTRAPVELPHDEARRLIEGRRVLVTGAGGSIGSELARQAAMLGCAHISLLDQSETALFEIDRQLGEADPDLSRNALLCDVRDRARLDAIFAQERPDLILHAAALKHVSMVERHPCEGVLTNVLGTRNVAEAARDAGVGQMVLISTDKAVDPANVMGATKRVAEAVLHTLRSSNGTRFGAVRFGNVLGSAGSVVPIFKSQIAKGGPVTVTHEDMARFFMTIPEAAQLVLHASAACAESEAAAKLFLLEMGEPVKIMDLARQMISLSGATPGEEIDIAITGLRPGEKLTESLLDTGEVATPCIPQVLAVESGYEGLSLDADLAALIASAEAGDEGETRRRLFELVARIRKGAPKAPSLRVVAGG